MEFGESKGRSKIQVSRSLGDFYMKDPNFKVPKQYRGLWGPVKHAVLPSESAEYNRRLFSHDKFFILASRGLWDHLSNDEAVSMVQKYPEQGIAKRLIHKALRRAARKHNKIFATDERRNKIYNDITVAVIFVDFTLYDKESTVSNCSLVSFSERTPGSEIDVLSQLARRTDLVEPSTSGAGPSTSGASTC